MKRTLLLVIYLAVTHFLSAQQLPLFTQYREHTSLINPAAIHQDFLLHDHSLSFGGSYRVQWTNFDNAPRTQALHGSFVFGDRSSFNFVTGGYLINDQTGPTGFTGLYARFGGILSQDPEFNGLAVGLAAGLVQYRVNTSEIRLRELGDNLAGDDQAQLYPDVGFGVFAYQYIFDGFLADSRVYGGLSVPQVIGLDLTFENENGEFYTKRIQHFYGLLGLYKHFDNDSFLEPSLWVKYAPNVPVNIDFNIRYQMAGNLWLGTGISTAGSMHVEAGFLMGENVGLDNNFRVGYGLDFFFSSFGPSVGSTHEINVAYSFDY